jgi:hypothetical protein
VVERPQVEKPEGDIPFDLGIDDVVVGDGDEATAGKKVTVHYVGVSFLTGEEFDASWNRGQPFEFRLGRGQVIPGWDQGVEDARRRAAEADDSIGARLRRARRRRRHQAARAAGVRGRLARGRVAPGGSAQRERCAQLLQDLRRDEVAAGVGVVDAVG